MKTQAYFGKCSFFGGPNDDGVAIDEGLALIEPSDLTRWKFSHLFLPISAYGSTGLARHLNPEAFYCAMRWEDLNISRAIARNSIVNVVANGESIFVQPCDFGPGKQTGRLIDLSPGAIQALGCQTDDTVQVTVILP